MAAANTDKFKKLTNNFSTTLNGAIVGAGDSSMSLSSTTNLPLDTGTVFVIDRVNASGNLTPTLREYVVGVVSGSTVISLTRGVGNSTAQAHLSGAVVEQVVDQVTINDLMSGILAQHSQTGAHTAITATSLSVSGNTALTGNETVGGTLGVTGATTLTGPVGGAGYSTATISNPYKFRVYLTAAQNATGSEPVVNWDTKSYDTGSNVDIVTNKGRFTAPISGFYFFTANVNLASATTRAQTDLLKNGSVISGGIDISTTTAVSATSVSDVIQLSAGDYVEVGAFSSATLAITTGALYSHFSGFLVSAT